MSLRIRGSVDLDGSGWEAGLRKMEGVTEHVMSHLKGMIVGAFGVAAIEEATRRTIEYGEKIVDTSRRVGIGVEALQEFGFAARQNGAELETLTGFIERLNSARIDPKKAKFFEALGIDSSDLQSMKVEDMMMKIGENVRNRSSQDIVGPLRQVGGRGAGEMIPMLKDNLEEVRAEAVRAGAVMKAGVAVELKHLADNARLLSQELTVGLGPAIIFVLKQVLEFVNKVRANGTFWGDFIARISSVSVISGKGPDATIMPWIENFKKSFVQSGAVSETDFQEMMDSVDKDAADRLKRQHDIEGINDDINPESRPLTNEHTTKLNKEKSDSLIAVGNFLGAGRSVIEDINRQQLDVLHQIARNTSKQTRIGVGNFDNSMAIPLV